MRNVILLCGPPGAGKTTAARASGLQVFDRDDEQWASDHEFDRAIDLIAVAPNARCVVIRACATSASRARLAERIAATHVRLLTADRVELKRRVRARRRADLRHTLVGIDRWFDRFDNRDNVEVFKGWDSMLDHDPSPALPIDSLGITSTDW